MPIAVSTVNINSAKTILIHLDQHMDVDVITSSLEQHISLNKSQRFRLAVVCLDYQASQAQFQSLNYSLFEYSLATKIAIIVTVKGSGSQLPASRTNNVLSKPLIKILNSSKASSVELRSDEIIEVLLRLLELRGSTGSEEDIMQVLNVNNTIAKLASLLRGD